MNIYNIYLTNELIGSVSGSSANCNELYMTKRSLKTPGDYMIQPCMHAQ